MEFVGILPEDAPDPRLAAAARLRTIPFPVIGFDRSPPSKISTGPGSPRDRGRRARPSSR